jgi:tight adherence protein B
MTTALLLAAMSLFLLAFGLVVWQWAAQRARRQANARFVDQQILQRVNRQAAATDTEVSAERTWHGGPSGWSNLLLRAGIRPTGRFYARQAVQIGVLPIAAWVLFNGLAATATLFVLIPFNLFLIWIKSSRRHRQVIDQLPDFLEAVVRMMTIGHSLGSAFQVASERTTEPLHGILGQARRAGNVGIELDKALRQTARAHGIYELYLIAAIVGVAIRVGGRTDHVLERMSAFMRDLTQARKELMATSAETRLSAWILALLPLGIGGMIIVTNSTLMIGMWEDDMGRKLLIGAACLQIIGSFWLYQLSKLK